MFSGAEIIGLFVLLLKEPEPFCVAKHTKCMEMGMLTE